MKSFKKCLEPNCTNKVEEGRTKCDRHRRMKQKLEREEFSIEELLEQADEKIEQFITPLVKNSRKFYVGLTGNLKSRKNDHKKDSKTCEMTEIFKAKNRDEAILMEAIMIHKLIFHGDANYRKFCYNASGGGRVPESKSVDDFCIYVFCDENPDATPGIKNKNMLFCDGNLSSVEIEKCVKIIIETKVLNHIKNDKKVKFGYSRNGNFQKRMSDYDYDKKIKYEKTSNIHEYILITSGEFIELENKRFLLTPNDIRKFELMFISQFWFLDYKRFSHLLINNGGGGDIGITKKENDSVNEIGEITREDSLIYLRVAQSGSTEDVRKMMKDIKIVD